MIRKLLFASVLALAVPSAPCLALDFTQVLMDDLNCPISENSQLTSVRTTATVAGPHCSRPEKLMPPDLTLGQAVYTALLFTPASEQPGYPGAKPTTYLEKMQRYEIAKRVRAAKEEALLSEELTLVKRLLGELYGPLIVGVAIPKLEPASVKK